MVTISSRREKLPAFFGSIRIKFFLSYVVIVAAVLVILNTYPLSVTRDFIFNSKYDALKSHCSLIASSISILETVDRESVSHVMDVFDTDDIESIEIVNGDGEVVYKNLSAGLDYMDRFSWGIEKALGRNEAFYSSFEDGVFISIYAVPIYSSGKLIGAICAMNYDAEQGGVMFALRSNLLQITAVLTVLSIFISLFFTQHVTARTRDVLNGIRSVREGEYGYRIESKGHDEIAALAEEFNSLTDRLQRTEEIRRRFVSDASHELKTPLAAIQLLSDSIVQNDIKDMETVNEFVSDIGDEARRLARTTEKLLRLTNLDNQIALESRPEDISRIGERAVKMLNPIAEERAVKIISDFGQGCVVLSAADDIYQIFVNLIENAVKYNKPGGSVYVKTHTSGGNVIISVSDTGVGIPDEDLPLIFDRFYRVDKARSRADGGSGLGLSIVKSSVLQYGGTITARRLDEGGMKFEVKFDLYTEIE